MKDCVIYIHGKGGSADEAEHYKPLFPGFDVIGLDYKTFTPWQTGAEIREMISGISKKHENIILIANSIGAFFAMNASVEPYIKKAYFISPVVDMEKLILGMMAYAGVTEKELKEKGVIKTAFGEDIIWDYLCYVRERPVKWSVETGILYGENDNITPYEIMRGFAEKHGAALTVMKGGEHWFHTQEQMEFLDEWIKRAF